METDRPKVFRTLRNGAVRRLDGVPAHPALQMAPGMGNASRGNVGVARIGAVKASERQTGQDAGIRPERRGKFRQVKRGLQLFDVALLGFCVITALVLWLK